jgi:AcrR family transcriptional regulator
MSEPTEARHAAGLAVEADARHDGRSRGDTRARIQQVALELFAQHGYDKTSLREIAERLDVTKAALYYHFKSKEDIVESLVQDADARTDELTAWARQQPPTPQARAEILSRYLRLVADFHSVFRMLHQNQAAVSSLESAKKRGVDYRERALALALVLAGPQATLADRAQALMAIGGMNIAWSFFEGDADPDELAAALLSGAIGLTDHGRDD